MAHIGIDIGTSYSSVCILNENGQPERVKIATGTSVFGDSYSLPSAVFLEQDGRLLLGQAAFASRMRAPQNFKAEFKRDLGQQAPYLLGGKSYLPEDLYKEFFIHIKKCVDEYMHESVTSTTVTFPAMFNENKKKLIEKAAQTAGFLDVKLIDEPSAAAYCYYSARKLNEGDTLLVYDLGGGTFDIALMRVKNGQFVQLTQPMGNPRLGGSDFDKLIFNDIMALIGEEKIAPIKTNAIHFSRFATTTMELAIKAKHHLSNSSVFSDYISVGFDGVDYTLEGSRYNAMIAPVIEDTMKQVQAILQAAGLKPGDVNKVLLVGGASRTPLVRELLQKELGQEPFKDIDPELAVCYGAAVFRKNDRQPSDDVINVPDAADEKNEEDDEVTCSSDTVWESKAALCDNRFWVSFNNRYGIIDGKGRVIAQPRWDSANAWEFCDGLLSVRTYSSKKYGYINRDGDIVISPQYEYAGKFMDGRAVVQKDKKYGFIDTAGKTVIPLEWDFCSGFHSGIAMVKKDGLLGYINTDGQVVIPVEFKRQDIAKNGKISLYKNNVEYKYDANGKPLA